MGTHAVCWAAMMRDSSMLVRRIAPDAVFPLIKDSDVRSAGTFLSDVCAPTATYR